MVPWGSEETDPGRLQGMAGSAREHWCRGRGSEQSPEAAGDGHGAPGVCALPWGLMQHPAGLCGRRGGCDPKQGLPEERGRDPATRCSGRGGDRTHKQDREKEKVGARSP